MDVRVLVEVEKYARSTGCYIMYTTYISLFIICSLYYLHYMLIIINYFDMNFDFKLIPLCYENVMEDVNMPFIKYM